VLQERQGVVCKILSIDTESLPKESIDPKRKNIYSQNTYFNQTNNSNGYHYKLQRKQCVLQSKKRVEELKGFYGNPFHTVALFPFLIFITLNSHIFNGFGFLLWDGVLINHARFKSVYTVRTGKNVRFRKFYKRGQQEKLN
jgi:acetyltransferase-like isoleucine patch superfamily enzyme